MTLTHALKQKHRQVHHYAIANPNSAAMGNRWLGGGFFEPVTWPRAALGSCQLGGRTWNRQGPSNYCSWEQTPHTRLQRGLGGAKTADIANVFKSRRGKGRPGLSFFHGFLVRQITSVKVSGHDERPTSHDVHNRTLAVSRSRPGDRDTSRQSDLERGPMLWPRAFQNLRAVGVQAPGTFK